MIGLSSSTTTTEGLIVMLKVCPELTDINGSSIPEGV
jgi:hypothetical protein